MKPLSPEAEKFRTALLKVAHADNSGPDVDLDEAARLFDSHQSARISELEAQVKSLNTERYCLAADKMSLESRLSEALKERDEARADARVDLAGRLEERKQRVASEERVKVAVNIANLANVLIEHLKLCQNCADGMRDVECHEIHDAYDDALKALAPAQEKKS